MMQVETTAPTELTHSALRADAARGVAKPSYRRLPWIMPHAIDPLTRFAVGRLGLDHDGVRVLEIKGRTSGLWRATPVRVLDLNGQQYLVAPQGETQWVRNLRVQRRGRLRLGGRVTDFKAEELSDQDKVPVLRAYFRRWWSQAARLTALTSLMRLTLRSGRRPICTPRS